MTERLIRTDAEMDAVLLEIQDLWDAPTGTPDADRRELLILMDQDYEARTFPVALPSPLAAVKFCMERVPYSQADLAGLLGNRSAASRLLSGERELSLGQIRSLHKAWDIPLEVLVQDESDVA